MRDAGLSGAPGLPLRRDREVGDADVEGMALEGLSPPDYALHPLVPAPPCLAISCRAGRGGDLLPPNPLPEPREAPHSLLLWGAPRTHWALPTPPHHRLPLPSCSQRLSPATRGAFQLHSPQSLELQPLSLLDRPYEVPPVPHSPALFPAASPARWLQHMGQVAALTQAWQHAVALPPTWHEHDRAAAAGGRQSTESEQ